MAVSPPLREMHAANLLHPPLALLAARVSSVGCWPLCRSRQPAANLSHEARLVLHLPFDWLRPPFDHELLRCKHGLPQLFLTAQAFIHHLFPGSTHREPLCQLYTTYRTFATVGCVWLSFRVNACSIRHSLSACRNLIPSASKHLGTVAPSCWPRRPEPFSPWKT